MVPPLESLACGYTYILFNKKIMGHRIMSIYLYVKPEENMNRNLAKRG